MALDILEGLRRAVELILSGDPSVLDATLRSLYVSGAATFLASILGLPIGMIIGSREFPGRRLLRGFFNALLGIPTVGLGLILYLILSRSGPLGALRMLYTPSAMILGQALLVLPILVSFTANAVENVEREIKDLSKTLGASELQASLTVFREALPSVSLAVIAGFNRALAELGVALMLGGNIAGLTRVLTTTIAMEATRGNIELSIALTIILLSIVFALSSAANVLKEKLEG
ncbi:ABC transporter permease subunit [Candidatus Bathyarchaeota archaeon]|nr:MAG: ABC transporter permease [Candidatus Bathyarchaeota archaeon ex4484_40]RJS67958.1 MAG: ABC transporter permease subunit [Candidatus Bathyarchaeota archaeon]RJS78922.1 MAG: ABC transporter permease subunit [Candidatus Bathyarchaeota archaeon]